LTGPALRVAQVLWLVVTLTVIALQIIGLPALYRQLDTVCVAATVECEEIGQPTEAQAAVYADAGLSLDRYAALITGIEALMVGIWIGVGVVIFLVRAHDWLALLVSLMLIVFSSATFISGSLSAAAAAYPVLSVPVAALAVLGEVLIVAFFLLFPNGRLFPRWLWWLIPLRAFAATLDYVPAFRSLPAADTISTFLLLPVIVVMLARFAATVRDETDLDALTTELVRVIQETMQPEQVSVWLRPTTDTTAGPQIRRNDTPHADGRSG
jgi:hypothetical protein